MTASLSCSEYFIIAINLLAAVTMGGAYDGGGASLAGEQVT